ncbi:MAG TPA: hypothetical protein VN616_14555 [Puia sp.]|nr:hypothetical protein [Puia sp.]
METTNVEKQYLGKEALQGRLTSYGTPYMTELALRESISRKDSAHCY